jgi:glycosyltransferase involved in cell wall biosynthesis
MSETQKKISIILHDLGGGGVERLFVNLANDWVSKGFSVDFILMHREGVLLPLLVSEVTVIDLNVDRIRNSIFPLVKYLRLSRPEVILAAWWPRTSAVVFAWLLSGRIGRLFLSDHENVGTHLSDRSYFERFCVRTLFRLTYPIATGIIAVSRGVRDEICLLAALPSNKVQVIGNAAAIGVPNGRESLEIREHLWGPGISKHILAVGRLSPEKDHQNLIRAFALITKVTNSKLVILGEGPLRMELLKLIEELGLQGRVSLPGFKLDPYPWYRSADLFVLSSYREGFGNVIVEALECGVPVVSTDCPSGPAEILNGGLYGKLVPLHDTAALASAMIQSLDLVHDHFALIRRAQDFSIRRVSDAYLARIFS